MNRSKWVAILGTTLFAGLLPIASSAAGQIDTRQRIQQARIHQGIRSGELTRAEAARLKAEEARIRAHERTVRRDGLTTQERRRLQQQLERASRDIRRQKQDRQDR
jgi:hypothetical protein